MSAATPSPRRPRAACSDFKPITHQGQDTSETKSILIRALMAHPHSNCTWSLRSDVPTQHVVYPVTPHPGILVQGQVHEQEVIGLRPRPHGRAHKIRAYGQRARPKVFEVQSPAAQMKPRGDQDHLVLGLL